MGYRQEKTESVERVLKTIRIGHGTDLHFGCDLRNGLVYSISISAWAVQISLEPGLIRDIF